VVTIIAVLGCVVVGLCWWYSLWQSQRRLATPLVSFGAHVRSLSAAERKVLINEHLRQQRWAFALVWFAVAVGVVLGGLLLQRLLFVEHLSRKELEGAVGLVGDISVAGGAFKLYKNSAKRLQEILEIALGGHEGQ
jgi:hypothetical protein